MARIGGRGDRRRRSHHWRSHRTSGGPLSGHEAGRHPGPGPAVHARPVLPGRGAGAGLGRHRCRESAGDHREDRPQGRLAGVAAAHGFHHRRRQRLVCAGREAAPGAGGDAGSDRQGGRAHRRELRAGALFGAVHGGRRRLAARRGHRESGAPHPLGEGGIDPGHRWWRAGLCLARRRHHPDDRRGAHARPCLRLCADTGAGGAHRVHDAARALCGAGRTRGQYRAAGACAGRRTTDGGQRPPGQSLAHGGRETVSGPVARLLADGRRLHLQHGPIDLVIEAFTADAREIGRAYTQACDAFQSVLARLVEELSILRAPLGTVYPLPRGTVARRMVSACWPHRQTFITPMAAVAGAVADEILAAMVQGRELERAYVNNGGDIAIHLGAGKRFTAGVVDNQDLPGIDATVTIESGDGVGGVATSGWRGRSQSLGIADAVSVLAANAAMADAAATLIANAVDFDHPAIVRRPARQIREDSDLGELPVTVQVGALPDQAVGAALAAGLERARAMRGAGLIHAAYLSLQGRTLTTEAAPCQIARGAET
ncbi:MAG: UPF0280 family protein [Alphaproteobacteria bacterium]|nr:UPF0280 family protein [Alphaproteobacteria bacterium]